jgi:hypothetical protein
MTFYVVVVVSFLIYIWRFYFVMFDLTQVYLSFIWLLTMYFNGKLLVRKNSLKDGSSDTFITRAWKCTDHWSLLNSTGLTTLYLAIKRKIKLVVRHSDKSKYAARHTFWFAWDAEIWLVSTPSRYARQVMKACKRHLSLFAQLTWPLRKCCMILQIYNRVHYRISKICACARVRGNMLLKW